MPEELTEFDSVDTKSSSFDEQLDTQERRAVQTRTVVSYYRRAVGWRGAWHPADRVLGGGGYAGSRAACRPMARVAVGSVWPSTGAVDAVTGTG